MNANDILEQDQKYCWHPFTQAQTAAPPLPVVKGEAEFLITPDGQRYFDAVSSWWVNLHGHCEPSIAQAIAKQAGQLEHVMFAGVTHPAAVTLAKRLVEKAPKNISRVFYSDNGSTAIEVALKMAFQYWHNQGQGGKRRKLLALEGAYHGDTFGAMSAGRSSGFYDPFRPWLFDVEFIHAGLCSLSEASAIDQLVKLLAGAKHEDFAAIVLEPVVQGASGMRMMRPEFVARIVQLCKQLGILVIFDEVMTGFGRTGTFYAADQIAKHDGYADILCLSKGLTGGFMPMGATLATEDVYEAFLDESVSKALLHGHSYTANPLGCAAALASLDLFDSGRAWEGIHRLEQIHKERLAELADHPSIENIRQCGTIAAFELKSKTNQYGSADSQWIRQAFFEHHIVVRPLGLSMYWIPPYCTTAKTMHAAYDALGSVLDKWENTARRAAGSELF